MTIVDVCTDSYERVDIASCDLSCLADGKKQWWCDDDIRGWMFIGSAKTIGHYEAAQSLKQHDLEFAIFSKIPHFLLVIIISFID